MRWTADRPAPRLVTVLEAGTMAVFALGVVAQFVQWTDPTFPLAYFTVDSAVLFVLATLAHRLAPGWRPGRALRDALTPAVVLSGVIYATVIAPAVNGGAWFAPHDDWVCRTAQVLVHGVGPTLAPALAWAQPTPAWPARPALWWLAWPLGYLAVVLALGTSPYAFLAPGIPVPQLVGTVLVLAGAYVGISWLCVLVARAGWRAAATHPSDRATTRPGAQRRSADQ